MDFDEKVEKVEKKKVEVLNVGGLYSWMWQSKQWIMMNNFTSFFTAKLDLSHKEAGAWPNNVLSRCGFDHLL